jgi:hypothetical protein
MVMFEFGFEEQIQIFHANLMKDTGKKQQFVQRS